MLEINSNNSSRLIVLFLSLMSFSLVLVIIHTMVW